MARIDFLSQIPPKVVGQDGTEAGQDWTIGTESLDDEARPACYGGDTVDANDPVYRSFDRWVKAGRPTRKAPADAKPRGAVTHIAIDDPEAWRLELAQRRERLKELSA